MFRHALASPIVKSDDRWAVAGLEAFDFLSDAYGDLYSRASATVFQSPVWLDRIYATLAPRFDARPLIITVHALCDDRLVAVIPLVVRKFRGVRVATFADFGVADYCAVVADTGELPGMLADIALTTQIRSLLRGCDLFSVRKVRQQDIRPFELVGSVVPSRAGLNAHASLLSPPFEDWSHQAMDASQRRSLDRKRRKLRGKGDVRVEVAERGAAIAAALIDLREFRAARFKRADVPNLLSDDVFARFYDEVASQGHSARAYSLRVGDVTVSVAFGVAHGDAFHMLLTGFNANFRNYSVGLLVIQDVIADCMARGEKRFDLTIGDQPYKQAFGTVGTPIWSVWSGIGLAGRGLAHVLSRSPRVLRLVRRMI